MKKILIGEVRSFNMIYWTRFGILGKGPVHLLPEIILNNFYAGQEKKKKKEWDCSC